MTTQEVIEACINKELELYYITYEDVKKGGQYEIIKEFKFRKENFLWGFFHKYKLIPVDTPWFKYYTFNSKEEYESWKEFCINLFRKELKMSKAKAEKEFNWFDLNYGLKQNYELDK